MLLNLLFKVHRPSAQFIVFYRKCFEFVRETSRFCCQVNFGHQNMNLNYLLQTDWSKNFILNSTTNLRQCFEVERIESKVKIKPDMEENTSF
jgi:hypothetical protein